VTVIEPGAIATEPANHITHADSRFRSSGP